MFDAQQNTYILTLQANEAGKLKIEATTGSGETVKYIQEELAASKRLLHLAKKERGSTLHPGEETKSGFHDMEADAKIHKIQGVLR